MTEQSDKTLIDIAITGGMGALVASIFAAIRAAKEHADDDFSMKRFAVGLFSAGGVGALVAWGLDYFSVGKELSAVIIAMCGYTGGRLLDVIEAELPETVKAFFDGIQKKLSEGRKPKFDD